VFGGDACRVPQCGRAARAIGMCFAHHKRWTSTGRPDPGEFAMSVAATGPWFGHAPLAGCTVPGCGFGSARRKLCSRHLGAWLVPPMPPAGSATASCGRIQALNCATPTTGDGKGSAVPAWKNSSAAMTSQLTTASMRT
jgi:hypothetical protein